MRKIEKKMAWNSSQACCAWLLIVCAVGGCGTGEYDARLKTTLVSVSRRAALEAMLQPSATAASPDAGINVRVPALFDASSKPLTPEDARSKIGGVALPGFQKGIERGLPDAANKFSPAYVYFAAVPKEEKKQEQLQADLQKSLAAVIPAVKWENTAVPTLAGASATFALLRGTGQQEFDGSESGGAVERLDGQLELYLVPADKHWVLIGWRAPTAQANQFKFFDAVKAAMGTVEQGAAPSVAATAVAATPAAMPGMAPMAMPGTAPMANPMAAPVANPIANPMPGTIPMASPMPMPMPMPMANPMAIPMANPAPVANPIPMAAPAAK